MPAAKRAPLKFPQAPRCAHLPWEPEPEPQQIDMNESTRLDRKQPHLEQFFTSVFASQDPRVFKIGVPPGIPRIKHGLPSTCNSIALNTSDAGEGVFRWDSRTHAFASETPGTLPPSLHPFGKQPTADGYQKGIGPDSYQKGIGPGLGVDTSFNALAQAKKQVWTSNSKNRRFWMSNAEVYQNSLPTFEFNGDDEDEREWTSHADTSHKFESYPARKGMESKSFCNSEFYEVEKAKKKALDPAERSYEASFTSKVPQQVPRQTRIASDIDPFHMSAIGPGMYGIPRDPNVDWGKEPTDIPREDPSFATTRNKSRLSVMEESMTSVLASSKGGEGDSEMVAKARAKQEHLKTVGPGQYWTPTQVVNQGSVSPERTKQNESKKGTSHMVGEPRRPTKIEKDLEKWQRDMPTAHYTHRKGARTWREGKGAHTSSRSTFSAQVGASSTLRWDKVDDKPRSLSRSISLKRIKQAMSESRQLQRSMSQEFGANASRIALTQGGGGTRAQKAARRSRSQNSFLPPTNDTVGYWPTDVLRSKSQACMSQASAEDHSQLLASKLGVDVDLSQSPQTDLGFDPGNMTWDIDVVQRQLELGGRPTWPASTMSGGG